MLCSELKRFEMKHEVSEKRNGCVFQEIYGSVLYVDLAVDPEEREELALDECPLAKELPVGASRTAIDDDRAVTNRITGS